MLVQKGAKWIKKIYKVALLMVLACITRVIQVHSVHASLRTPAHDGTGLLAGTDADFHRQGGCKYGRSNDKGTIPERGHFVPREDGSWLTWNQMLLQPSANSFA